VKLDTGPQTEDGYTQIANELLDALTRTRVPGEERQMFDFILRKTYGFNKKMDMISLSQFVTTTGVKRQNVHSSLKSLFIKRIVKRQGYFPVPAPSLFSSLAINGFPVSS